MKTSIALLIAVTSHSLAYPVYQLHEWGTFTTVSGSDGILLSGLQREEEPLPAFVHSHFGFENGGSPAWEKFNSLRRTHGFKGFTLGGKGVGTRPVSNVTVKMETPVIYFHSEEGFRASVNVGFNGGTISQWFPEKSAGEKLPEPPPSIDPEKSPVPLDHWQLDFSKPHQGSIQWDVNVLSRAESSTARIFKPRDTVNWLRARVPEANALRTDSGETENYLFYRGIGNFQPGLQTRVSNDDTLHLENLTGGGIPYLLVFQQEQGRVSWSAYPNGLQTGESLSVPEKSLAAVSEHFPEPIYQSLKKGLTACGLLDSEANAMVQTWWSSYFETEGLRVFWVLPETATHRILPLKVTPVPQNIVRVIVGRSEVLRPRQEAEWLALSRESGRNSTTWTSLQQNHRFGLAIQERVKALDSLAATGISK